MLAVPRQVAASGIGLVTLASRSGDCRPGSEFAGLLILASVVRLAHRFVVSWPCACIVDCGGSKVWGLYMARASSALGWLALVATGVAVGALASDRHVEWINRLSRKGHLSGATPLPPVVIMLGTELWEALGSFRDKVLEVPDVVRGAMGFAPTQIQFSLKMDLGPFEYQLHLRGLNVGSGTIKPQHLFAVREHGDGADDLPGEVARDARSGRWGIWIAEQDTGRAHLLGYHALDAAFVMALHVETLLRRHLYELLTREETYRMLESARRECPRTVDEVEKHLSVGLIQGVLQNLLREQVALLDLPLVLELMSDASVEETTPDGLTRRVRVGLARQISAAFADGQARLHAIPFDVPSDLLHAMTVGEPSYRQLVERVTRQLDHARHLGLPAVLVAPGDIRSDLRRLLEQNLPDLPVLAKAEVASGYELTWLTDLPV